MCSMELVTLSFIRGNINDYLHLNVYSHIRHLHAMRQLMSQTDDVVLSVTQSKTRPNNGVKVWWLFPELGLPGVYSPLCARR